MGYQRGALALDYVEEVRAVGLARRPALGPLGLLRVTA